jgi:hypothetical protein
MLNVSDFYFFLSPYMHGASQSIKSPVTNTEYSVNSLRFQDFIGIRGYYYSHNALLPSLKFDKARENIPENSVTNCF